MLKIATDFSGIGSPEQALKNLKIKHKVVFSCEIDKHARKSYEAIHSTAKFYEDITKRNHSEVEKLDLYVAGFPCQAFSMAGKRLGFEDTRGTLFFNVAEFIKINQPKVFILENVKGLLSHDSGRTFETIKSVLSDNGGTINGQTQIPFYEDGLGYHIYFQVLNTKEHGIPQNRERIFIIGFKDFREFSFPKNEPLKLKLKDLLQSEVDEKYFLSEKMIKVLTHHKNPIIEKQTPEQSACIHAGYFKMGGRDQQYIKVKSATAKGYEEAKQGDSINLTAINSKTRRGRVGKNVAQTLDTLCEQGVIIQLNKPRHSNNRLYSDKGISPTLNTMQGGNRQPFTQISDTNKIRRLTPLECWRLQGFPDEQFFKAAEVNSDTQLYKQAGNSITVNVIQKIIAKIYES